MVSFLRPRLFWWFHGVICRGPLRNVVSKRTYWAIVLPIRFFASLTSPSCFAKGLYCQSAKGNPHKTFKVNPPPPKKREKKKGDQIKPFEWHCLILGPTFSKQGLILRQMLISICRTLFSSSFARILASPDIDSSVISSSRSSLSSIPAIIADRIVVEYFSSWRITKVVIFRRNDLFHGQETQCVKVEKF